MLVFSSATLAAGCGQIKISFWSNEPVNAAFARWLWTKGKRQLGIAETGIRNLKAGSL